MGTMNGIFVAVTVVLAVTAFASQASAQDRRDATIEKCIMRAHAEWPDSGIEGVARQRAAVYKACMAEAGERP